jgi:hypothetical protein
MNQFGEYFVQHQLTVKTQKLGPDLDAQARKANIKIRGSREVASNNVDMDFRLKRRANCAFKAWKIHPENALTICLLAIVKLQCCSSHVTQIC